jgi:hypothetical protein
MRELLHRTPRAATPSPDYLMDKELEERENLPGAAETPEFYRKQ